MASISAYERSSIIHWCNHEEVFYARWIPCVIKWDPFNIIFLGSINNIKWLVHILCHVLIFIGSINNPKAIFYKITTIHSTLIIVMFSLTFCCASSFIESRHISQHCSTCLSTHVLLYETFLFPWFFLYYNVKSSLYV